MSTLNAQPQCLGAASLPSASPPPSASPSISFGFYIIIFFSFIFPYKVSAKITSVVSKNEIREIYII